MLPNQNKSAYEVKPVSVTDETKVVSSNAGPSESQEIISQKPDEGTIKESSEEIENFDVIKYDEEQAWKSRLESYGKFCSGKSKLLSTRTQRFFLTGQSASQVPFSTCLVAKAASTSLSLALVSLSEIFFIYKFTIMI